MSKNTAAPQRHEPIKARIVTDAVEIARLQELITKTWNARPNVVKTGFLIAHATDASPGQLNSLINR